MIPGWEPSGLLKPCRRTSGALGIELRSIRIRHLTLATNTTSVMLRNIRYFICARRGRGFIYTSNRTGSSSFDLQTVIYIRLPRAIPAQLRVRASATQGAAASAGNQRDIDRHLMAAKICIALLNIVEVSFSALKLFMESTRAETCRHPSWSLYRSVSCSQVERTTACLFVARSGFAELTTPPLIHPHPKSKLRFKEIPLDTSILFPSCRCCIL